VPCAADLSAPRAANSSAPRAAAPTVPPRNPYSQPFAGPVALQEREKEEGGQLMKSVGGGTGVFVPTFNLGDDDEEEAVMFCSRPSVSSPNSPPRPSSSAPPTIQGRLPVLLCLRGTSPGESSNKQVNAVRNGASHLAAELGDARVGLRVQRNNYMKDHLVKNITGIEPKPLLWYLHEAKSSYILSNS